MFTLAIFRLTTFNLPWFMDLTFQVPMQYCSLQHPTLLPLPVRSTTGCCFCFGSVSLFFLELFLHWSPVAYWAPTNLGSSSFSYLPFFLFLLFMGFSRQENWSGLPFPSPVDHVLSVWWSCDQFGYFPDQRLNLCPQQWKCRVLTMRPLRAVPLMGSYCIHCLAA